jgi:hypothetical protein
MALRSFACARRCGPSPASIPHALAARTCVWLGGPATAAGAASRASSRVRRTVASRIDAGERRLRRPPTPLSASCSCLRLMVASSAAPWRTCTSNFVDMPDAPRRRPASAFGVAVRPGDGAFPPSLHPERLSRAVGVSRAEKPRNAPPIEKGDVVEEAGPSTQSPRGAAVVRCSLQPLTRNRP